MALAVVGTAVAAWVVLVWSILVEVDEHGHTHGAAELGVGALLVGWGLMVVAMMLPTALPMIEVLSQLVSGRRWAPSLVVLGVACFVAVWTVVGLVLVANSAALTVVARQWEWLAGRRAVIAGIVLVGAGAYQLSPLKNACLRACRTPTSFAFGHWRGRRPVVLEVIRMIGAYSASCVGCCWALMAVCFAAGTAVALPVMLALSVAMAAERLASWGLRLVRPLGYVLIASGVGTAVLL
ncbi:MAG: DUF2182 domain-containing protein [Saccharothrix sp.]|nr:DUF2182 domain-containing protein [Saccharothrix sp.]